MEGRKSDPSGHLIDYNNFTKGRQLREILISEQGSLCAYTGAGIDDVRLAKRQPRQGIPPVTDYWYTPHIEHLNPQAQCRADLVGAEKTPGVDKGEDIDYHNMVAALKVDGIGHEQFGAINERHETLPVKPTDEECDSRFRFDGLGQISGLDNGAIETIRLLKLDHKTLNDWRLGALEGFGFLPGASLDTQGFDPVPPISQEDLHTLKERMDTPFESKLVEFCFVIKSYAQSMLPPEAEE